MCPILECLRSTRHFWSCRMCLGYGPAPRPTLKMPCALLVCLEGRMTNSVFCWLSLTAAVTQLRLPDVGTGNPAFTSRGRPSSSLRRPSPQAVTLLGGARFIAGRLFLGGMPTRLKAFLEPLGKVIYWELCKLLMFGHTDKCYKHNQNLSKKMGLVKFSGTFRYQRVTKSLPENEALC